MKRPEKAAPIIKNPASLYCSRGFRCLAEKPGFEPGRRLSHPTPLAGEPLRPLGYFSIKPVCYLIFWEEKWRRERDSNPRCLSASLVFKTSAINRSAISPSKRTSEEDYNRSLGQSQREKWVFGGFGGVFSAFADGWRQKCTWVALVLDQMYGKI